MHSDFQAEIKCLHLLSLRPPLLRGMETYGLALRVVLQPGSTSPGQVEACVAPGVRLEAQLGFPISAPGDTQQLQAKKCAEIKALSKELFLFVISISFS